MSTPKIAFEMERLSLPLEKILPVRQVKEPEDGIVRYKAILASIREVGVIEPLMVYPQKGSFGSYFLMDGHLRYYALKELKIQSVDCLVSTEDESFTYNARISRLAPIQEHRMIVKAVKNGVPAQRIAAALNLNPKTIRSRINLLDGIHPEAAELLKDKQLSQQVFTKLKRVKPLRQIEIVDMMVGVNNFTMNYVAALVMRSSKEQFVNPNKAKTKTRISPEEIARMEQEMESLGNDLKAIEETYSENMMHLTFIKGYVKNLLGNAKVVRFLNTRHHEFLLEFERIAAAE